MISNKLISAKLLIQVHCILIQIVWDKKDLPEINRLRIVAAMGPWCKERKLWLNKLRRKIV